MPEDTGVDARLHAALAAGEADIALPMLMQRYGAMVYRYSRRILGNDDGGRDVSQTVFLQAYEAIRRRSPIDNARSWLLGITRHRCLDQLDKRKRTPISVDDDALEQAMGSDRRDRSCSIEVKMIERLDSKLLDDCMDGLDERSRMVILLRFHDDLSYDEISALTGDSPGALRVRVARALPALRRCLELKGVTL